MPPNKQLLTFRQGGDPLARNASDAAALQAKVEAKKAKQAATNEVSNSKGPVPMRKVDKKNDTIDDLLSAGLTTGKKNKK